DFHDTRTFRIAFPRHMEFFTQASQCAVNFGRGHHSKLDHARRRCLMIHRKARIGISAQAPMAAALAAVLAGCGVDTSTPSTANTSPTTNVPDPPARESDLPEIVVTARALRPGEGADEGTKASDRLSLRADLAKSREATVRK